jgi:thiamine-phosphate pyrophosphorylase
MVKMKSKKELFLKGHNQIYCFADNLESCLKLLSAGARIIQFRNKTIDNFSFYQMAKKMLALVSSYQNAILIINDKVDIAVQLHADGIHLGQTDEPYSAVIKRIPDDMLIGVSVDNEQEAIQAEKAGISYVGAGSVFPSATKADAPVIGIVTLQKIVQAVNIPVVAIGGISLDNICQVRKTGVQYIGIISQINNDPDIPGKFRQFHTLVNRGKK